MPKNFRKRKIDDEETSGDNASDDEETRLVLEEVKLLQKQRGRKSGIPATNPVSQSSSLIAKIGDKGAVDGDKEELVLQDTFAQETAVMVEDPNMLKFIEQELAKKRGKNDNTTEQAESKFTDAEDELYKIPEHLKEYLIDPSGHDNGRRPSTSALLRDYRPMSFRSCHFN